MEAYLSHKRCLFVLVTCSGSDSSLDYDVKVSDIYTSFLDIAASLKSSRRIYK